MLLLHPGWDAYSIINESYDDKIMYDVSLKLHVESFLYREVEEKRSNLDGNVDEIAKELQRMENKKNYLEEEKTDLSEALDRQRHIFESKVFKQAICIAASNCLQVYVVYHEILFE